MLSTSEYWDREADSFDAIYHGKKRRISRFLDRILRKDMYQRFDWVMERAEDIHGKSVCDIGCGSGRFSIELAKRGATQVLGLDVAENMLNLARDLAKKAGMEDRCEFSLGDIFSWKNQRKYDYVLAIGLFDYVSQPAECLSAMHRITDSTLLASFPRAWTLRAAVRKARLRMRGCPVYFYTESQLSDLYKKCGFQITDIKRLGQLHCVTARANPDAPQPS